MSKKSIGTSFLRHSLSLATLAALGLSANVAVAAGGPTKEITLIHMGDLHGHLIPRPNLRSDGDGRMEGGLARMYKEITKIREDKSHTMLLNTGDTTQGSGEALYTKGQAMLDVVDMFGVDAFAPGNWEFVYGPERFVEEFGEGTGVGGVGNRWGALASNLYKTARSINGVIVDADDTPVTSAAFPAGIPASIARVHTQAQYDDWSNWYKDNGERILQPFAIKELNGVKLGILGCTTRRGPQVVGSWVVDGIEFTDCANEVKKYAKILRTEHQVDLVVLISEIEVGVNIQMAHTLLEDDEHVDVILNSDMHEETLDPIQITNKSGTKTTLLIEEGQDGTMIGELTLKLKNSALDKWDFVPHRIADTIPEDRAVADKVAQVRAPFTTAFNACHDDDAAGGCRETFHKNSFSGTYLTGPLDDEVGTTEVGLHRSNYSDEPMPAVLEGTSHDFIADAIRWWAGSDIATVRGFRYGTHVKPGPITRNDLYHFVPIGARVGKASRIHANQIRNQVDNSSQAVFSSDPISALVRSSPYNNNGWAGGWMFAYSGDDFSVKFDPYGFRNAPGTSRARDLTVSMPCDRLPATEQSSCTDRGVTHITNATNGGFMSSWAAAIADTTTYALQTDPREVVAGVPQPLWYLKKGKATKQNQLPAMTVAGYWYEQSPLKLNNCPNCNPVGTSNNDRSADAAYILPVNVGDDGKPLVYSDGKPKLLGVDGNVIEENKLGLAEGDEGYVAIQRDSENRPLAAGNAIELVTIIEKYLAEKGPANPRQHRVTLANGVTLPGRDVFGHPVMQPLCGTIPETTTFAAPGVTEATTDTTDYRHFQCWKDSKTIVR